MAGESGRTGLRSVARMAGALLVIVVGLMLAFALSAWIGAAIPRNADWQEPAEGITILIGDNGVHTEIVMPLETEVIDWRDHFPLAALADPSPDYTNVGLSWGERAFFLQTPSWSQLDPITGLSALAGEDALLHAAFYVRPAPADDFRPVVLRPEEYRRLATAIAAQVPPPGERRVYPGYDRHDFFTTARGRYHLGNTCNQWTSDQLANAGVQTGWWTPLPGGVMQYIARP